MLKLSDSLKARYLCLQILFGVFKKRQTISQILENQFLGQISYQEGDLARAERFSNFIFGHLIGIDECINLYLKKSIKLEVRNIFRLVVAESFINESPDYAIVNSAVQLSKLNPVTKYVSGLVNAVSRKIVQNIRNQNHPLKPALNGTLKTYLGQIYPDSVVNRMEEIMFMREPIDITVKYKDEINFWKEELNAFELPTGALRLGRNKKLSTLSGFNEGKWWVQGISSSIPVKLLGNIAGVEVLDLFSAPGGKAMQLISAGAKVTCLDGSLKRLKVLKENLARMKMKAKVICSDIQEFKTNKKYNIILIDAPCSSSGTLRKNMDMPHLFPVKRMADLLKIQSESLKLAKSWMQKDGIILYCTCSLFPAEGEEQISQFLKMNPGWIQKVICAKSLNLESEWVDKKGGLRLRPDYLFEFGGMDGFYAAILVKKN